MGQQLFVCSCLSFFWQNAGLIFTRIHEVGGVSTKFSTVCAISYIILTKINYYESD